MYGVRTESQLRMTALTRLDLTLPTAQENLALDEAMLRELDAGRGEESLRFWESPDLAVVLGALGRVEEEVDRGACEAAGIKLLRRSSGGGTVLLGPGCLDYSLVFSLELRPEFADLTASYRHILQRVATALGLDTQVQGTSDLARGTCKFSGNAQQRLPRAILHHGTILYDFDVSRMTPLLRHPPREPSYRDRRTHESFAAHPTSPWSACPRTFPPARWRRRRRGRCRCPRERCG